MVLDTDIEFFLALGTLISGLLILLRRILARPRPQWLYNTAQSFFPVLLFVLLLRAFIIEPFRIPSGSMIPTLQIGDFIAVNKFTYGVRMPITHWLIFENNLPQRGDVIVFRFPTNPTQDYIKRVVGVPGDHIRYDDDKQLAVNGEPLEYAAVKPYHIEDFPVSLLYKEEYLGDTSHGIVVAEGIRQPRLRLHDVQGHDADSDKPFDEWEVPQGHYFVMGDNRDNSNDSRMWGFVPQENLVGKAFFIWMSWDYQAEGINFSRVGMGIE